MEGYNYQGYQRSQAWPPPATDGSGQNPTQGSHGFQNYPADGSSYPQYQGAPMPFPSQLTSLNPSYPSHEGQSLFQPGNSHFQAQPSQSNPSVPTAPRREPYVQPYGEFSRGDTIGDPVSVKDEKGRVWQNYRPDKYFLPNDAIEQDRLDFAHRGFCLQLQSLQDPQTRALDPQDVLHLAPLRGEPTRVLDIGTGTGIWAIEYARRHPTTQVIGTDLSLIQPNVSATVPNVSFIREDVEDDWVEDAPFDYIHARLMFSCFVSHRDVIRKAFASLKPGGWMEYQDLMLNIDADDNSHRGSALHKWSYLALAGAAGKGRDLEVARKYKDYMLEAGFIDVVEIKFKGIGNAWPTKEPDRTIGEYAIVSGAEVVRMISEKLLGEGLGLPEDLINTIVSQAQKDVFDTNIHYWWPGYVVYGRKPFDNEQMPPPPRRAD